MISVLIPVYNHSAFALVSTLIDQARAIEVPCEIIVLDDGSTDFKDQFETYPKSEILRIEKSISNLGRSRARNKLAELAKYPFLLLLDCDGIPVRDDFLERYLEANETAGVLVGGSRYEKPENKKFLLHYTHGIQREIANQRGFKSNNFFISKELFQSIRFDESLKQYGHEDTLFGVELDRKGIEIRHIDNPVIHQGLEEAATFLGKSLTAIENAWKLYRENKITGQEIRVLNLFLKWNASPVKRKLLKFIASRKKVWERICLSDKPKLYALDFMKLIRLSELARTNA